MKNENTKLKTGKGRRIVGSVAILLVLAFTVYLSAIMLHRINSVVLKENYIKIFCYELVICAIFLICALDIRFGFFTMFRPVILKAAGWVLRVVVIIMVLAVLLFMGKITVGGFISSAAPAENVLVLGLALENGKPTDDLLSRLNTARDYLEENPGATLVLTGGNPDESGMTEAALMRELLLDMGVAEEQMLLEDKAETTKDNFRNAAELIDPDSPVLLITSDYHMDRAVQTAKNAGFTNILRLPAPSSAALYAANVMWELILEVNELTFRQ